jgi:hypothetical protein
MPAVADMGTNSNVVVSPTQLPGIPSGSYIRNLQADMLYRAVLLAYILLMNRRIVRVERRIFVSTLRSELIGSIYSPGHRAGALEETQASHDRRT